jgi:hypothetical protein
MPRSGGLVRHLAHLSESPTANLKLATLQCLPSCEVNPSSVLTRGARPLPLPAVRHTFPLARAPFGSGLIGRHIYSLLGLVTMVARAPGRQTQQPCGTRHNSPHRIIAPRQVWSEQAGRGHPMERGGALPARYASNPGQIFPVRLSGSVLRGDAPRPTEGSKRAEGEGPQLERSPASHVPVIGSGEPL